MNSPKEVAANYVGVGKGKVALPVSKMLVLSILAGMFIACAAVGANTASCTIASASASKLIGALVFPCGLAMVLVAGSELFTGNTLLVIPLAQKEITVGGMLNNWLWVYIGNFIGSMIVVGIACFGTQWNLFGGALAVTTIKVAATKVSYSFLAATCLGIGCNFLVCIAVWISFCAKTVVGKIVGLFMPIMLFVLSGFEHSVANMYYIPAGLVAAANPTYAAAAVEAGVNLDVLTWGSFFLNNLLPVTIGNIIGGSLLVGMFYWFAYLRGTAKPEDAAK
ncbi:MAG: formate/nitrite transporter family protein [Bacillota bacterium]|nr:formate/nitrite transporter family protein [Bacillota bacterium]